MSDSDGSQKKRVLRSSLSPVMNRLRVRNQPPTPAKEPQITQQKHPKSPPKRKLPDPVDSLEDEESMDSEEEDRIIESATINYFMGHTSRAKTSGKTLRDIDLSALRTKHDPPGNYIQCDIARQQLAEKNETSFSEMYHLLFEGATVIVHGFGSKKKFLETFVNKWLSDEYHLIISGFFPEITLRHMMLNLKEALDAESADEESLLLAATEMEFDLYLIIHSLDILLASSSAKLKPLLINLLTKADGKLHIIASVDHIHSSLLFNSKEASQFNLVWFDCPSFEPYSLERGYATTVDGNVSSAMGLLTLNAIEHVYDSLNPNAQKIFLQILNYYLKKGIEPQLDSPSKSADDSDEDLDNFDVDESDDEIRKKQRKKKKPVKRKARELDVDGLPFSTLYRICREEYLVNSEITLKAQLTEFKDHKVIKFNKRSDGTPIINLLINLKLAEKFIERVEDSV